MKNTDIIKYNGTIKVTVKNRDQIISSKTYHNNGGDPLFTFLSNCIISNNYNSAEAPRFIKLFTFDSTPLNIPSGITKDSTPICPAIYFNASEIVDTRNPETGNGAIGAYMHFTIPCSAISSTTTQGNLVKIYQAGLYSANYASNKYKTKYSAAFNFTTGNQVEDNSWAPVVVSSANGDYNIFIEWTLSFSNN